MSKRNPFPTRSVHIEINEDDWEFLTENFGKHTSNPIGPGPAIRAIVHSKVKGLRSKMIEAIDQMGVGEEQRDRELARRLIEKKGAIPNA
jgi:hypothetical protein